MCRILAAIGNFSMQPLLKDFVLMARDRNERHENNVDKEHIHDSGWGIAYLKNGRFDIYKTTTPCFEDEKLAKFESIRSSLVILHARRAVTGGVRLENTSPFYRKVEKGEYVFCHNGTVKDRLRFDSRFYPLGDCDSEQLFYYLLTNLKANYLHEIADALKNLKDYTALNIILSDGNSVYIANRFNKNPKYYTMKIARNEQFVIVSSEILPSFARTEWEKLTNGDILQIGISNRQIQLANFQ